MRLIRNILLALVALVAAYLLAAVAGALIPGPLQDAPETAGPPVTIRLVSGPIHYDFLLPLTPETRAAFAPLARHGLPLDAPGAAWLIVGWGAREFYTTTGSYADLSAAAIWRSFTGDASVLRVDVAGPLRAGLDLPALALTAGQYSQLLAAISGSFRHDETGAPIPLATPGFGPTDRFFAAHGRFDILRTCNTWVAAMLRAAGLRFGAWTPTPYAVTLSLARFAPDTPR
ncbi:TIGR02117 family protein [Roseovarius sp.]|uniref:TIGR02117 family protein n=1 Tax=Roseovarius sp. TaxID=1486281 RepID=UPI002613F306|nr:TIGR02117 family protein [Roseovarius sp.]MDM8164873.1 TIGR02117 family protein [Roseovarius sp.]